jgi:hypothetical protein
MAIFNPAPVDGGPYPGYWSGYVVAWANNVTKVIGRHTTKYGVFIEPRLGLAYAINSKTALRCRSGVEAERSRRYSGTGIFPGSINTNPGSPFSIRSNDDVAGVGPGSGAQFCNQIDNPSIEHSGDFNTGVVWFDKTRSRAPQPARSACSPEVDSATRHSGQRTSASAKQFHSAVLSAFSFEWKHLTS